MAHQEAELVGDIREFSLANTLELQFLSMIILSTIHGLVATGPLGRDEEEKASMARAATYAFITDMGKELKSREFKKHYDEHYRNKLQ